MWKLSDYSVMISPIRPKYAIIHTWNLGQKIGSSHIKQSKLSKSGPCWNVNQIERMEFEIKSPKMMGSKTTFSISPRKKSAGNGLLSSFIFFGLEGKSNREDSCSSFLSLLESSPPDERPLDFQSFNAHQIWIRVPTEATIEAWLSFTSKLDSRGHCKD